MRALAVVLAVLLAPAAFAAVPASQTERYVAAGGDVLVECEGELNLGGACFDLDGSETFVTLTVRDDRFRHMGAYWAFDDGPDTALSNEIAGGEFCDDAVVGVPWGAVVLHVYVDQAYSTLNCPHTSAGTTGSITAVFG